VAEDKEDVASTLRLLRGSTFFSFFFPLVGLADGKKAGSAASYSSRNLFFPSVSCGSARRDEGKGVEEMMIAQFFLSFAVGETFLSIAATAS